MKYWIRGIVAFCLIIVFVIDNSETYAYKFEFVTVSDVVKNIKKRFSELDSYQADFKLVSEKYNEKMHQNGRVKYKASNKMIMQFRNPYGQKIVSNGKTMWIYIPSMNVVVEQDLKHEDSSLFSTNTRSGLRRLFSKYHYKFASKKQPEEQSDGSKKYTLFLKQRESRSGFRTLKLWVSEDYFITKAYGESSTGKKVKIEFKNT